MWQTKKLGEICKTSSGGTPSRKNKKFYDGEIPWVKSGELNFNTIRVKDADGPDDFPRLKKIEHRSKFKNWFEKDKSLGGKFGYGYKPKISLKYAISDLEKMEGGYP